MHCSARLLHICERLQYSWWDQLAGSRVRHQWSHEALKCPNNKPSCFMWHSLAHRETRLLSPRNVYPPTTAAKPCYTHLVTKGHQRNHLSKSKNKKCNNHIAQGKVQWRWKTFGFHKSRRISRLAPKMEAEFFSKTLASTYSLHGVTLSAVAQTTTPNGPRTRPVMTSVTSLMIMAKKELVSLARCTLVHYMATRLCHSSTYPLTLHANNIQICNFHFLTWKFEILDGFQGEVSELYFYYDDSTCSYKAYRYKSEARVHTSFYSHCCHPLHRCFPLQNGELKTDCVTWEGTLSNL
jgi:hypothetical protein